jgi:hypothetical protein
MTFIRTVLIGTIVWVAVITFLHAALNWRVFDHDSNGTSGKFRIGFLPVT